MGKKLRKIVELLLLLIVLVIVVAWFSINGIIRSQIQQRAAQALGVKTTLANASLNIFSGRLTLRSLDVANPPGFAGAHMLKLQSCRVNMRIGSLLSPTVKIDEILMEGLNFTLDQHGLTSNLSTVMDHLRRRENTGKGTAPSGGGGKALAIGRVLIKHIIFTLRPALVTGQPTAPIVLHLKQLKMDHPTNPNGRPLRLAGLMEQVLAQIAAEAARSGRLPAMLRQALSTQVSSLPHGTGPISQGTGNIGKAIGHAFRGLIPSTTRSSGGGK